jgi:hypothetical protein
MLIYGVRIRVMRLLRCVKSTVSIEFIAAMVRVFVKDIERSNGESS